MDVRISRADFVTELAPMQGIVERKTTIPALAHILLTARQERLGLAATDLDVSLTSWCAAEVTREGALAVQAKKLVEIVRAVEGDEVRLSEDEPNSLTIRAGKSRFKIRGLPADDFPTLPTAGEGPVAELSYTAFKRMIGKVLFAVSAEESRFQLNGALMKIKEGTIEMVATDGHRLALVENSAGAEGGPRPEAAAGVLVPRKALQELQRFEGEGTLEYRHGAHHLSFRVGKRELVCRILEGTFPDYERVIAKENDNVAVFERRPLLDTIRRVALLTGDRARTIRFQLTTGTATVSAANPDLGEAVEEIGCDYEGPELRLGMNPDYVADFLGAVETDRVRFQLKDENTQAVGFPVEGPDERYLCVIMPMRI